MTLAAPVSCPEERVQVKAVAWAAPTPSLAADAPSPTPAGAAEPTVADCGCGLLVSQDTAVTGFCVPDLLGGAWLRECRNGNAVLWRCPTPTCVPRGAYGPVAATTLGTCFI